MTSPARRASTFHDGSRRFQDRFDTRRLADRIDGRLMRSTIGADERAFIERMDMFFLATADAAGQPQCSYKGGDPGFVRVLDEYTLAFPSYDGNGMYLSLGNLTVNPHVGLLFIDFRSRRPSRLRVNGIASIDDRDPLLAEYAKAQLVVRVRTTQVFPNCPRYIHRMQLVERSRFVPRPGREPPVPDWKRAEWACDVLPRGDPATREDPQMSTRTEPGYTIAGRDQALDFLADYPGYGEQRWYSDALGTEQVSFSWRRMPPATGGRGSYGHRHPGQEEVYFVVSGTVTFKVGDDVFQAGPQTAVRMTGHEFYSLHNDADVEAELLIFSTRVADPPLDKQEGFWP